MPRSADAVARRATRADAQAAAGLLDAFNREFSDPSPGVPAIARRLGELLETGGTFAFLAVQDPPGGPAGEVAASPGQPVGVALVTLRPNVWYQGPVALLDELYVVPHLRDRGIGAKLLAAVEREAVARGAELLEITVDGEDSGARRFYARHGYATGNPGQDEPQFYYSKELGG